MENNNRTGKFINVGQVWQSKDDESKSYIRFGNTRSKDSKYNYTVEIIVKDSAGQEVYRGENPFVNVNDPHPASKERVPSLLADLSIFKKEQ